MGKILVTWVDPAARGGPDAKATVTKEGIRVAAKMTRAGHPQHGIAATLGMGRDSFRGAIARQPELAQALDTSLGLLEQEMVSVMVAAAKKGAWAAACALLKGKFGFREHGAVDQPASQTQINIVIPPRLTDEDYDKILKDITPPITDGIETETKLIRGVVLQKSVTK